MLVADGLSHLMEHSLSKGLLAAPPGPFGDSDFILSHLRFAYDTSIFSSATPLALQHLFEVIHIFEVASDLSINLSNSELFGTNLDASIMDSLASSFGCKHGHWSSTCLEFPLGGNCMLNALGKPIIERVQHKLHNWK